MEYRGCAVDGCQGSLSTCDKRKLKKRMEEMGFEANLVRWVESFIQNRKESMLMDRKEGDSMDVETGVQQGSPGSPVLFIIDLSGFFGQVKIEEEDCRIEGISCVDDVAWVIEGEDAAEFAQRLQRCAAETIRWMKVYACQFEVETTEAILFNPQRMIKEPKMKPRVRVGNHEVQYDEEVTRWLGVWLDDMHTLNNHTKKTLANAGRGQNWVKSFVTKKGLSSEGCQTIQVAEVQAVALYASDLWW